MCRLSPLIIAALVPLVLAGPSSGLDRRPGFAGKEVEPHSRPYMVYLHISSPYVAVGAGVLLTDQWILTSASFVDGAKNISAFIGAHTAEDVRDTKLYHDIVTIRKHPDYEPVTGVNDIAFLRMGLFVYLDGKLAKAIRLPAWSQRLERNLGVSCETFGWGLDEYNHTSGLRSVALKVAENSLCTAMYGLEKVVETHLCVYGTSTEGSFEGYAGGPLVITEADGIPTLIGIHSRSTMDITKSSVYTRVSNYLGWLTDATTGISVEKTRKNKI